MADTAPGLAVITSRCATAGCHAAPISDMRAPDLSTQAAHIEHAVHMYEEAEAGEMPPTGALPSADLEALRVYLACTAQ